MFKLNSDQGFESLLVTPDHKPHFRFITGMAIGFFLVAAFVKGKLIYVQLIDSGSDVRLVSFLIISIFREAFDIFFQLWFWSLGILLLKNSTPIVKFISPPIFFAFGGAIVNILFDFVTVLVTPVASDFEVLNSLAPLTIVLHMLVVILTKCLSVLRNRLVPYFIAIIIVFSLGRLYTPGYEIITQTVLEKLHLDYYVLLFVSCLLVLRLLKISTGNKF